MIILGLSIQFSYFSVKFLFGSTLGEEVLRSSTICLWGLMCNLSFSNSSFTYVSAFVLGSKMFRIETSSTWIVFPCDVYEVSFSISSD